MKSARRTYLAMNWRAPDPEWDFARCLRLAHAEVAGRERAKSTYSFTRLQQAMEQALADAERPPAAERLALRDIRPETSETGSEPIQVACPQFAKALSVLLAHGHVPPFKVPRL